jgi:hypothetical protein
MRPALEAQRVLSISGRDTVIAGHDKETLLTTLAEFFFSLDRNLEDVDNFYNKKYAECARRLRLLHGRYGRAAQPPEGIDQDEVQDLIGALLELRSQLHQKHKEVGQKDRPGTSAGAVFDVQGQPETIRP